MKEQDWDYLDRKSISDDWPSVISHGVGEG